MCLQKACHHGSQGRSLPWLKVGSPGSSWQVQWDSWSKGVARCGYDQQAHTVAVATKTMGVLLLFFLFLREDAWLEGIFLVAINIFDWLWVLLSVVSQRFGIFSCPRSGSLPPGDTYYRVMAVRFQPTWQPTWRRPLSKSSAKPSSSSGSGAGGSGAAGQAKARETLVGCAHLGGDLDGAGMGWWMILGYFFWGKLWQKCSAN